MTNKLDLSYLPEGCENIRIVSGFEDLMTAEFDGRVNCILWPRRLSGDFNALADVFWNGMNVSEIEEIYKDTIRVYLEPVHILESFKAAVANEQYTAQQAEEILQALIHLQNDADFLAQYGMDHVTRALKSYPVRGHDSGDVNAFHADRMGWDFGRVVICYNDPATEFLRNEDVDYDPQTYAVNVKENAQVYRFHSGDVVRMSSRARVNPLIHRGTMSTSPRLLTIGHKKSQVPEGFQLRG